jgi:hypothetical protein
MGFVVKSIMGSWPNPLTTMSHNCRDVFENLLDRLEHEADLRAIREAKKEPLYDQLNQYNQQNKCPSGNYSMSERSEESPVDSTITFSSLPRFILSSSHFMSCTLCWRYTKYS